jgi:hypothetical protein
LIDSKTKHNLILTAVNSNIQDKENKDIYIKGLAKVAIDSSMNNFIIKLKVIKIFKKI